MVHDERVEGSDDNRFVFQIHDQESEESVNYPVCEILLDGKKVNTFADSCSPYTLIAEETFKGLFKEKEYVLEIPDIHHGGYNKEPIPLKGMVKMCIQFKDRHTYGRVYITERGSNLLGWKHQKDLGITLDPNNNEQVLLVDRTLTGVEVCKEFPEVFTSDVGVLKNYVHKIKLKNDAIPIAHKTRSIPLLKREPLKRELERLEKQGIIQAVETSEWLAPIVITSKKTVMTFACVWTLGASMPTYG